MICIPTLHGETDCFSCAITVLRPPSSRPTVPCAEWKRKTARGWGALDAAESGQKVDTTGVRCGMLAPFHPPEPHSVTPWPAHCFQLLQLSFSSAGGTSLW